MPKILFKSLLKFLSYSALPNTRLESKTDSMAYSRVAVHLLAFKKELCDQGKGLIEANAWPSVVDHGIMAWNYVMVCSIYIFNILYYYIIICLFFTLQATPNWDNATHNNIKKQCFKALATNLNLALKRGTWNADVCINIKNKYVECI